MLGIHEFPAPQGEDGWFLSDFFAFWHIFQGITDYQTWYHCLDLDELVATHQRYLHGNPHGQRKVVLDANILTQAKRARHPPQHIRPEHLKLETKKIITRECKAAELAGESVLILLLGHGDISNHGIELGTGRATLKVNEFKSATKQFNIGITMTTTSCYSGGWTCNPQLNISTMTAAGNENTTLSSRFSRSTGRACGSMFTTALIEKLISVGDNKTLLGDEEDDDDDDEYYTRTDEQLEIYAEFTRTVHEHLLKDVDRRGYEHHLTFVAQDDAWKICWGERTGITLVRFKERWDELEDWATDATLHLGDPINRDPSVTDEQLADYLKLRAEAKGKGKDIAAASGTGVYGPTGSALGKRKTSGLYGGTDRGLIGIVSKIGPKYVNSYKCPDGSADDGWLHHKIDWIQQGYETDTDTIEKVLRYLDYRMAQMATADTYLEMMGIAAPNGQSCCEYDTRRKAREIDDKEHTIMSRLIFDRMILFPRPFTDQGRPFHKGMDYLIGAFHHADTPKEDVIQKLDALVAALDRNLEEEKERVKHDPEVASKRRELFQSWGVALGNM